jgi:hypothetical protein
VSFDLDAAVDILALRAHMTRHDEPRRNPTPESRPGATAMTHA